MARDQHMRHRPHHIQRFRQHELDQPRVLARHISKLTRPGTGRHRIEIDEAPFDLGDDLLGDGQHVRCDRRDPGRVDGIGQHPRQIVPRLDFTNGREGMDLDHADFKASGSISFPVMVMPAPST